MINAFGKKVTRDKAIEIIIKDFIGRIVYSSDTEFLEHLLLNCGWVPLEKWNDKELEDCIDDLCEENHKGEF